MKQIYRRGELEKFSRFPRVASLYFSFTESAWCDAAVYLLYTNRVDVTSLVYRTARHSTVENKCSSASPVRNRSVRWRTRILGCLRLTNLMFVNARIMNISKKSDYVSLLCREDGPVV